MGKEVSLVKSEHEPMAIKDSIAEALRLINFEPAKKIRSVIIKPNLNYYWETATGCTTDPKVVGALIDYLREKYGQDLTIKVAEADASAMRTKHVFPMLGYEKLADEKGIELLNLSLDVIDKKKISVNGNDIEFEVPKSLLDVDFFINVPKLKTMRATKITCAMKNIFGCIATPRKLVYHPILNEAIVGINMILKPHLTIVDGLIGLGRFPVKLDVIMASVDVFSIDWTVAQIVGYNPRRVGFLNLAIREKMGDPHGISVHGESLETLRKKFPKEGFVSQKWLWSIEFGILHLYKKVSGDVIPPFLEEE